MRPHPKAQETYALHAKPDRERKHLGYAENLEEITQAAESIGAKWFSFLASCVDRQPTVRLATEDVTRRMSLGLLTRSERLQIPGMLEGQGVLYQPARYLELRKDFSVPVRTRVQMCLTTIKAPYDAYLRVRKQFSSNSSDGYKT